MELILVVILFFCMIFIYHSYDFLVPYEYRLKKGYCQIPGPKGYVFIGSTYDLSRQPQRELRGWARQYGEIFKVQLGWQNWVFVNSLEAVRDIFDKQAAATSSRMPAPVAADLISGGLRFLLMPNDTRWRKLRTIVHKQLTPTMSNAFRPSQELEGKQLLNDIMCDNNNQINFYVHIRRYTASVMMTSTYGRRVPKWDCEDILKIYNILKELSDTTVAGAFIADMLPFLARMPVRLQWWRTTALKYQKNQADVWMKYWTELKKEKENGQATDCFVKQWIESTQDDQDISDMQGAFLAGTMIEAGSESTSATLISCLKYLGANPSAQTCIEKELSTVVGNSHSPTFADQPNCPYICACVKEILRLRPSTNNGTPHYTTSDVFYKDFRIPKDTVVSINQYAINYDPSIYESPEKFRPERHLPFPSNAKNVLASCNDLGPARYVWGAGRRICPGMYLAQNSLFITVAKILWAFEVRPPLDDSGVEETLDVSDAAYEDGRVTIPKPFKLRFIPRNRQIEEVIKREWSEVFDPRCA